MDSIISVIVPVYNLEKYIEKTVHSILEQSYTKLEIILVDDGSTDNSAKLLDTIALKDFRIRVIHKTNGGVTLARLAGVAAATGDWIGFVDGDDIIEPDMYERLLKNAVEHEADISHCGYQMVFPSRVDYYYNSGKIIEQDNYSGLKDLLSGAFVEPGLCNKLYKKKLVDSFVANNVMDTDIRMMEDYLMNFWLFREAKKSVYEDWCPYHYMVRRGSAATSKWNAHKLDDPIKVFSIIRSVLQDETLISIVENRLTANQINLATLSDGNQKELIAPRRTKARLELRKKIPCILRGNFSSKLKFMALWAGIWPGSYTVAHTIYSKVKGTDRKYEVD